MATGRERLAFSSAFLQAFNAVDDAVSRRQRNEMLEKRLDAENKDREAQRKRVSQLDKERAEDRAIAKLDRDDRLRHTERAREANALLADPEVSDELLAPYSDIPEVSNFMAARAEDANLQAASRTFHDEINANAQPGVAPGQQATQQPGNQFTENVVGAAELPGPSGQPVPIVSEAEINRIADEEGVEAAIPFRDARAQEMAKKEASLAAGPTGTHSAQSFRGGVSAPSLPDKEAIAAKQARTDTVGQWQSFVNVNDPTGEPLRQLDSNILTAKYFDDRSNVSTELSPDEVKRLDKRMAPHVAKTVETQTRILAASDPSTPEARNARRKLGEAYGVQQEIFGTYQPLAVAGVDARGLTTNGTNEALTNSAIEQGKAAPGAPYPDNPNRTRADMTMVQRGTKGRVSEKLAQSAWRLMKGGLINNTEYDHVMRTGRMPTAAPVIKDHDPKKDLIAVHQNGSVSIVMSARDPDAAIDAARNTWSDDALKQLNSQASALDDESDDARGTRTLSSFLAATSGYENLLRSKGYDLGNVNDAMILYQRFIDTAVLKDAYDSEWRMNGWFTPDFNTEYGTIWEAMFDKDLDKLDKSDLEVPGTTSFGFGGEQPGLVPLKPRNPAEIQAVMQATGATAEEAEELIAERERAGAL